MLTNEKGAILELSVAERKMIRWKCNRTRLDMIKNEVIRNKVKVKPVCDKMRETRLRWFDHVKMSVAAHVRRCQMINFLECGRSWGRREKS